MSETMGNLLVLSGVIALGFLIAVSFYESLSTRDVLIRRTTRLARRVSTRRWVVGATYLVTVGIGIPMLVLIWTAILELGVLAVALGLGVGIPTSLVYHVKLARALGRRGELPPRWWLSPTRLHARLRGAERRSVLRWFFLGGAGFVITLAGCAAALVGALLAD